MQTPMIWENQMNAAQVGFFKPYRFVRYGRLSSDRQVSRSLASQFANIDDFIARKKPAWIHVGDFREDGNSSGKVIPP